MPKRIALVFLICSLASGAARPSAFLVCALRGDDLDLACENSVARFRAAGYEVHRIDGPTFSGSESFRSALRAADRPFVHVLGHGAVTDGGFHRLFLGRDGAERNYPTSALVRGIRALNPGAQIFVEACRSGQVKSDLPDAPWLGTSCRADEYSPIRTTHFMPAGRAVAAESAILSPIFDLLESPSREFKYWSGGKCSIGGEALREYLFFKLSPHTVKLTCEVSGVDPNSARRAETEIARDESRCAAKIDRLGRVRGVRYHHEIRYELAVECDRFKPGERLRVLEDFPSREALAARLDAEGTPKGPARPLNVDGHDRYRVGDLVGRGCRPALGFVKRRHELQVVFSAIRDGAPSFLYEAAWGPAGRRAMPFLPAWEAGERAESRPHAPDSVGVVKGVATPDLGALVFRHANCDESEGYLRRARGAGLSWREPASHVGVP